MDKAWKRNERDIAKFVGGTRVPITGRQRGDVPDIEHNWLALEAKYRKTLPEWLHDAMRQAEAAARPRQMPVVVLREKGMPITDCYFAVRAKDFKDWFL
jgi:hypothetical protein